MQSDGNPKVRATIYLPLDVLNEARDAAVHLAGYPARLTLTQLAENALRAELRRLEKSLQRRPGFSPPRRRAPWWPSHCSLERILTTAPRNTRVFARCRAKRLGLENL